MKSYVLHEAQTTLWKDLLLMFVVTVVTVLSLGLGGCGLVV